MRRRAHIIHLLELGALRKWTNRFMRWIVDEEVKMTYNGDCIEDSPDGSGCRFFLLFILSSPGEEEEFIQGSKLHFVFPPL